MSNLPKALKELVTALVKQYGLQAMVVAADKVRSQFRKVFHSRNILILGPKGAGKTSLIYLLEDGKPYKIIDGEITTADPTAFGVIVGHKFQPQGDVWLKVSKDLPGDIGLRETWKAALTEVKPHGIIFMIDGRKANERPEEEIKASVLSAYPEGPRELSTLHVFVNFSDQWGSSEVIRRKRLREIADALDEVLAEDPRWSNLRVGVHSTQLSCHVKSWEEALRALQKFGSDLGG